MGFNTSNYGLFLVLIFFVYWLIAGRGRSTARIWFLLAASYFFYANWNASYLFLIAAVTAVNFFAGLRIESSRGSGREGAARQWLWVAAVFSLGCLAVFKYYNFFISSVSGLLETAGLEISLPMSSLLLPVGISFFTFQSLSYSADVYRGRIPATRSLRDFALYVAFFPQLVAGPIVRARVLIPQLQAAPVFENEKVMRGLFQVLSGLFKKMVIADLIAATLVDQAFAHPEKAGLPLAWLAMYGYALQIYCDFSGYSDVAIGSARMLGIEIPANFNRPYLAANLRDFWRRWHISLSTWLRDYLYISLGGSKKGRAVMYAAILVTMVLGGLWHGAAWTFVAWGAYHGALLMMNRLWQELRPGRGKDPAALVWGRRLVTFHLVCLGWIIFRSTDMAAAWEMMSRLVSGPISMAGVSTKALVLIALGYFLHLTPPRLRDLMGDVFVRTPAVLQGAVLVVMVSLFSLVKSQSAPFIYFQF